ncbi:hypothetical protein OG693_39915 [Streptomyces sp. NBC_01259]|uniref:hypothetical protein n=1 Tax=Streptomyces sp. NBC_01259 TaxID=2903800 RepID=UPI0032452E64
MKFRTTKERYTEDYTREGKTVSVPKTRDLPVPVMPRNWDRVGVRVAVVLVVALTLASITWSTWSIGELFKGGPGYIAAGVFDLAWGVCLLLTYLGRFDADKRTFSDRLGWWLLVATMGLIFWHGMNAGSVGMAVGGAAVSLFAKVLWLGVMKHVHRDLSPEDAAWVKATVSEANAKMAVADARRMAAQIEQRATLELLAMEKERDAMSRAFGLPVQSSAVAPAPVADATDTPGAVAGADAPAAIAPAAPAVDVAAIVAAVLAAQSGASARGAGADEPQDADVIEDQDDEHGYADQEDGELLPPLEPPTLSNLSKADAIRIALRKRPELAPAQISELLAGYDVKVTADYVRQVRNRDQEDAAAAARGLAGTSGEVVPIRKEA